jgi:hypothetical protein
MQLSASFTSLLLFAAAAFADTVSYDEIYDNRATSLGVVVRIISIHSEYPY